MGPIIFNLVSRFTIMKLSLVNLCSVRTHREERTQYKYYVCVACVSMSVQLLFSFLYVLSTNTNKAVFTRFFNMIFNIPFVLSTTLIYCKYRIIEIGRAHV